MKTERIVSVDDLSNDNIDIVKVPVDDRGAVMFIGSLSSEEFIAWQEAKDSGDPEMKKSASALLMMQSLVKGPDRGPKDEELSAEQRKAASVRIGTPDMVAKFRRAKVSTTERLLKAILKLNHINQKDEAAAKND